MATVVESDPSAHDRARPPRWRAVRAGWCQLFGIPDYERYLEHMALNHPDATPLGRREFVAQAIDRRYGRMGPRCC